MIAWPRLRAIFALTLPIAFSLVVQTGLGLVSTAVVGRLGDAALAGVGTATALVGVLMALINGIDAGVQAVVSRRIGAGETRSATEALIAGLWISLAITVPLSLVAQVAGPAAVGAILHDPAAVRDGAAFLAVYSWLLVPLGFNVTFSAYWNGSGAPARALAINLLQLPIHAATVWALAFGALGLPRLGVAGAGLGALISCACATLLHAVLAGRIAPIPDLGWRLPSFTGFAPVFRIGLPISVQQSLQSLSLALYFAVIAGLGTASVASADVMSSIVGVSIMASVGIGVGAGILAGTALGRRDGADAALWGWQAAVVGAALTAPLSLALLLAPREVVLLFLNPGPTVELSVLPLRLVGATLCLDSFSRVLTFALRGTGATRGPAAVGFVLQWFVQLPLSWWVGVSLGYGLPGVAAIISARALVEAAIIAWLWRRGGWRHDGAPQRTLATAPNPLPRQARRIAILGGAGAGKSTLARELGEQLGLPVIHLDRLVFDPGWTRVGGDELQRRLAAQLGEAWVVEGTYREAAEITHPRADLILWLEAPTWLRILRSWRKVREHTGRPRADRPDGCDEAFGWRYIREIVRFGRWNAAMERQIARIAPDVPLLRLTAKEAAALLCAPDPLAASGPEPRELPLEALAAG